MSSSSGRRGKRGSSCGSSCRRSSSRNACNESSEVARVVVTHRHHSPGSGETNSVEPTTMVSTQPNCSTTSSFSHHGMIRRSEKRTRTEAFEREEEEKKKEEDFLNDDRNNSENDPDRKLSGAAAAAAAAAGVVVSMPPRKTRNRRSCSNGTSCSVPTCIFPTPPRNEKPSSSSIHSCYTATERSKLDILKVGPMSYVLTFLEEIDLHQLELAFWDIRQYSLPQWQALRQADISSIHCAKWRHSHNNRQLFLSLVRAIRPPSKASRHLMKTTKATSTTTFLDEWARASHAYRTAGYIMYAKDYVHHSLHVRKLLRDCQGRPPVPISMTIGDLARSGYFVFVHLTLNNPPHTTSTATSTTVQTATSKIITNDDDSKIRAVKTTTTTTTTVTPDCIQSKSLAEDAMTTKNRMVKNPIITERKPPQHFDAFRKVRQAVYYPSTDKMLLKFENPVAHFLGMRSEWPQIKSFNDWHQIDWTILNQLKLSGRIGTEIESVLSYERNCHARLLPLLQNMDIAITLPKHCLDDEGNSVYPPNQVQQRLGVRPPPPDVLGDFFADAQRRALQAQLQRLQQETMNLRRQLNGLAAQVNGLVADVHRRDRAMNDDIIDHAVLLQRLQHAGGNVVHHNLPQQMNMNPPPVEAADGNVNNGINNNNNNNNNNNHVVEGNRINNGNIVQGNVLDDQQMEAALVRRNALQPSSNPPSPETFVVTGRCTKLLWTSQYNSEFRRPILQSLPPGAPRPHFTTDIFLDHDSRRSPPPKESQETDGTTCHRSVTNTSTCGSIISSSVPNNNNTIAPFTTAASVSPWEVSIPVTPTLVAIFEVYRRSHPDDE